MRTLRSSIWVPTPPDVVWTFFADAHNLPLLVPPFLKFKILTPAPIAMHVDARIDYRISLRGLPMRWRTRIAGWDPPHSFADEQERGPYKHWYHVHTFEPVDGGTVVGDHVEFAVGGGPLSPLLTRWFVLPDVQRIFHYRLDRIRERFGGNPTDGTVWLPESDDAKPVTRA
jgi:ligand-binding SRPBCC domain-containing protein